MAWKALAYTLVPEFVDVPCPFTAAKVPSPAHLANNMPLARADQVSD